MLGSDYVRFVLTISSELPFPIPGISRSLKDHHHPTTNMDLLLNYCPNEVVSV
jgi:hypothetical protein